MNNAELPNQELSIDFTSNSNEQINHFLVIQNNPNTNDYEERISLQDNTITIGRNEDNVIVLNKQSISRYHAHLIRKEKDEDFYYEIIDGDIQGNISKNGIFINNVRVKNSILKHGDLITLGLGVNLKYYIGSYDKILIDYNYLIDDNETDKNNTYEEHNGSLLSEYSSYQGEYSLNDLLKFASIVSLFPTPMIEINEQGKITFINTIAKIHFPNIDKQNFAHPIFKNILPLPINNQFSVYKREVKVNDICYEQYIHYLTELKLVRLYLFDITANQKRKQILKNKIEYDDNTKLPNYKFFLKDLQKSLAIHKRNNRQLAVMIVELENLYLAQEDLNDKLEKTLLREFAKRIQKCFREEDTVAYWRNNQFIISISELTNFKDIGIICDRLFNETQKPITNDKNELLINVNIGISVYPYDAENKEDLIRKANQAVNSSKHYGENQYTLYSPKFNFESQQNNKIIKNLKTALQNQEFTIYYQPIINYQQKEVIALEALIRWNNPQLGMLYPQHFLELAERIDIISELTWWMLEEIFALINDDKFSPFQKIPIAVNLSIKLFNHPLIWRRIIDLIKTHQDDSKFLILEVTEQVFLQDSSIKDALKQLLGLGVKIALDDFGSAYSSLDIVRKFPFHFLKIDHQFTKQIKDNTQDKAIISAINTIAKGFNMKVIAEGIENQQHWDIVEQLGCDYGQGYLFCKPLPLEEIYNFLQNPLQFEEEIATQD